MSKEPNPSPDTVVTAVTSSDQTRNRRYPMSAIEQMLADAGYGLTKVNKRYFVKKGNEEFHQSPEGFQWYELYRFCMESVLGREQTTRNNAPGTGRRVFSKLDVAFLLKQDFYVIKDRAGYLLVKDDRSLESNLPQEQRVAIFKLDSKDEAASFTKSLRDIQKVAPGVSPALSRFTDYLKTVAKSSSEAADLVETILGFEYRPLFKVTDLSMKLVSKLSSLSGGRNFKINRTRFLDVVGMSVQDVNQLIADGVLIQHDKFLSLGTVA